MQKSYCDLCGKELKPNTLRGGLMRLKIEFPVLQGPRGEMAARQQISDELWDLCEDCQKWLFGIALKKREELQKKESSQASDKKP